MGCTYDSNFLDSMDPSSVSASLLGSARLARSTIPSMRTSLDAATKVPQIAPRLLCELNEVANCMDVLYKPLSLSQSAPAVQRNPLLFGYLDVVLSTCVLLFNELKDLRPSSKFERSKRPPKWWNRPEREVGEILERLVSSKDCIQVVIEILGL